MSLSSTINKLLIEFCDTLFSVLTIINKYENVDIGRTTTGPLKHCFTRDEPKNTFEKVR